MWKTSIMLGAKSTMMHYPAPASLFIWWNYQVLSALSVFQYIFYSSEHYYTALLQVKLLFYYREKARTGNVLQRHFPLCHITRWTDGRFMRPHRFTTWRTTYSSAPVYIAATGSSALLPRLTRPWSISALPWWPPTPWWILTGLACQVKSIRFISSHINFYVNNYFGLRYFLMQDNCSLLMSCYIMGTEHVISTFCTGVSSVSYHPVKEHAQVIVPVARFTSTHWDRARDWLAVRTVYRACDWLAHPCRLTTPWLAHLSAPTVDLPVMDFSDHQLRSE